MSEFRKDPIVGRWVIIATERGKRPSDFPRPPRERRGGFCPFCEGNEEKTPTEVLAWRRAGSAPDSPGWRVRVVSNRYPALEREGEVARSGGDLFDRMNGVGAHEVVIESPHHERGLNHLTVEEVADVLRACRDRMRVLGEDPRLRYVLVFKNYGFDAGATLEHSHMQIIATPIIPQRVADEMAGSRDYLAAHGRCVFCDIAADEESPAARDRLVARSRRFAALAPVAPRFPYETWILPLGHASHFETTDGAGLLALAGMLRDVLTRMERALDDPDYNFVIHTAPCREEPMDHYHWHVEILPKLTRVAGFEWGSGFFINPTPPELAAAVLRRAT